MSARNVQVPLMPLQRSTLEPPIASESTLEKVDDAEPVEERDESELPTGVKLYAIMGALLIAEVLVGLDQTIVATCTATIANEFSALQDVGWYGSAYLLTCCSLMPLAGRAYAFFSQKYTFLFSVLLFELGSVVSAVAQSSTVFIVGRALQGAGYGGVFVGVLAIAASSLPLRLQPVMTSLMGAAYGAGAVCGPLIGGAITSSSVGWRLAFWINLPPGAITAIIVILWCNPPPLKQTLSVRQRILHMDWAGAALLLGSTTCLLIALQEGGLITPWKSSKIIGLLVGFVVLFAAFFALQIRLGDAGSISTRLLRNRSIAFTALENFCFLGLARTQVRTFAEGGATYYSVLYYVPIYLQTVQGSSPVRSGVQTIAIVLPCMLFGTLAGAAVSRYGSWHWEMLFGTGGTAIAAGLLATMNETTSAAKWIGYQVLAGAAMGALYMLGFIASQVLLPAQDRARGSSVVVFFQLWGATIWVSASEAIYQSSFAAGLEKIPGLDAARVLESGVTGFRETVSDARLLQAIIKVAVVPSLFNVFVAIAALGALGTIAVMFIEWKKIDVKKKRDVEE